MPSTATSRSSATFTRMPKASVRAVANLCRMHKKSNCGVVLEPESSDPVKRGTRGCCRSDYESLRRMADGSKKKWRAFELLGWCDVPQRDLTKRLYAELVEFEKEQYA